MPKLIIICGLPGVGKSTLANALSKSLKLPCLHKDIIKEKLYELENASSLAESRVVGKKSIELLYTLTEDILTQGADLIVEAPFYFEDDSVRLAELQDKLNLELYTIICKVDEETRDYRIRNRPRHNSHHDQERLTLPPVKEDPVDYSKLPGKKLFLNTSTPLPDLLNQTLKHIQI